MSRVGVLWTRRGPLRWTRVRPGMEVWCGQARGREPALVWSGEGHRGCTVACGLQALTPEGVWGNIVLGGDMRGLRICEELEPPGRWEAPRSYGSRVVDYRLRGKGVRSVGGAVHHASARFTSVTIFTEEEAEALRPR